MFPAPAEIDMSCSCPDWAGMCKHVAATLYGVGSRLDHQPELLFKLGQVDHLDLIAQAASPIAKPKSARKKTIADDQLADVFGIDLQNPAPADTAAPIRRPRRPEVVKVSIATGNAKRTKTRRRPAAGGR